MQLDHTKLGEVKITIHTLSMISRDPTLEYVRTCDSTCTWHMHALSMLSEASHLYRGFRESCKKKQKNCACS